MVDRLEEQLLEAVVRGGEGARAARARAGLDAELHRLASLGARIVDLGVGVGINQERRHAVGFDEGDDVALRWRRLDVEVDGVRRGDELICRGRVDRRGQLEQALRHALQRDRRAGVAVGQDVRLGVVLRPVDEEVLDVVATGVVAGGDNLDRLALGEGRRVLEVLLADATGVALQFQEANLVEDTRFDRDDVGRAEGGAAADSVRRMATDSLAFAMTNGNATTSESASVTMMP